MAHAESRPKLGGTTTEKFFNFGGTFDFDGLAAQEFKLCYCEFGKFNKAAEEVATQLLKVGVSVGDVVALVLDRNVAQVVAIYGVLKAGAAYVPVDFEAPRSTSSSLWPRAGRR